MTGQPKKEIWLFYSESITQPSFQDLKLVFKLKEGKFQPNVQILLSKSFFFNNARPSWYEIL